MRQFKDVDTRTNLQGKEFITMKRNSAARAGFTLIELMAVVLILAILAGVALPKFFNYQNQAKVAATKGTLGGVRAGIANYYAERAISAGTAVYPTIPQLNDGSTMQETIPENPYNDSGVIVLATTGQSAARTVIAGGAGWAYYDTVLGGGSPVFYANTNTAGVGENTF